MSATRMRKCPGYTGFDTLRYLLPQATQARLLSKTWFAGWAAEAFKQDLCVIQTPAGVVFVVDGPGKVRKPREEERARIFDMP